MIVPKFYRNKNGSTFCVLPKAIADAKGIKQGQEFEWIIDNLGNLILKPKQYRGE